MEIAKADEAGLVAAAEVLLTGGVAVVPTDTVYGLAAHPGFPSAVERLYSIKGRDRGKPIALLASDAEGAAKFVGRAAAKVGSRHWPGALTVVSQGEGVRVPDHAWTRSLIAKCGGALRVTSANASGHGDAVVAKRALEEVGVFADIVVDGGPAPGGEASTVVRIEDGAIEVLREGPVKFLVLASGSPRRAKILRDLGVDFVIRKSDAPEVSHPDDPERTVRENALAKGSAVDAVGGHVLSADTIVWFGGRIYGKPRDAEEAKDFLRELSGRVHIVFTGVAYDGEVKVAKSDVKFRELSDEAIDKYVAEVNPIDRAGAYDIDESGDLIVEGYSGSYENIMGLPVEPLKEWGIVKRRFRKIGMFGRIVIAIVGGIALGFLFTKCGIAGDVAMRILKTFNCFFNQILRFIVPLLILGLVTPAIADAGKGAGKLLVSVMLLSYISTCAAALFGYFASGELLPLYVQKGAVAAAGNGKAFLPYVDLKIPPVCDVLTALTLAFMVGVGIVFVNSASMKKVVDDFSEIVKFSIMRAIIPGLPVYIMTMICEMTASGKIGAMASTMLKVIGTGWALTIVFLVSLYVIAGFVTRKNPLRCLWNMSPAYLTALSIASSLAVIPVTLNCCEKNGISKDIRNFVVPICANVHMVGSAIKMMASTLAVVIIYNLDIPFAKFLHFTCMFAIAAVAAPGVMCGVLMASVGFLESILGLTSDQVAVMMTFYMALDGYGPAANVTGDGAIALVADRFFGRGAAAKEGVS